MEDFAPIISVDVNLMPAHFKNCRTIGLYV